LGYSSLNLSTPWTLACGHCGLLQRKACRKILLEVAEIIAQAVIHLDDANIPPFTAPKVEQATKTGIIQAMTPRRRLPKV